MARYSAQHLLSIVSPHGDPCGGGWYEEGAEAVFSVTSPIGVIPQRFFTGWSGDSDASSHTSRIVMDGPKTVTTNWETNYTRLYILLGILAVTASAVLIKKSGS